MELFDLYTAEREKTGKTMVRGDRTPDGYYRLVVHVSIFYREGRMLIRRSGARNRGSLCRATARVAPAAGRVNLDMKKPPTFL